MAENTNDPQLEEEIKELENEIEVTKEEDTAENAQAKTPIGLKIVGFLSFVGGLLVAPQIVLIALTFAVMLGKGGFTDQTTVTFVVCLLLVICLVLTIVGFVVFGIRLLRNKRRKARLISELLIVLLIADVLCALMLNGITGDMLLYVAAAIVLIGIHTYIDPSLSEERNLQRKLRKMETREDAESGTLGRDESGRGFITLDFFDLFWIFVIACIFGDFIETIYHIAVVDPGHFQNRTGMLWGPFSPIYGFGAVLMTVALNRFYKTNIAVIFSVSAVIGGALSSA